MSFRHEEILAVKHYEFGASGSGNSSSDPASPVDGDIYAIPAGAVIYGCDVIVKSAVTGTITVGDDDDADGYATSTEITEGTAGVYPGNGAYITSSAKKYYAAAGKEVKLDQTTISAGSFAVVVRGYRI
jgi:hypothetical protein